MSLPVCSLCGAEIRSTYKRLGHLTICATCWWSARTVEVAPSTVGEAIAEEAVARARLYLIDKKA